MKIKPKSNKEYIRNLTVSGDYYSGTIEKWQEYHDAWDDNDMGRVMHLEQGNDPDFYYDP